jgi:RNA polymerase sigma factor (sigma-70 family)
MGSTDDAAERELIAGLRRGDNDAFHHAVARYTPAMLAAARAVCDPDTAEDVVQEAWLAVIDAIEGFEGRSALGTWLCRIAANRALDRIRRGRREVLTDQDSLLDPALSQRFDERGHWSSGPLPWSSAAGDPAQQIESDALAECIREHLQRLPENHRVVLMMCDVQQLSSTQVCNILDLKETNVRVMLHRARQRMFTMIEHFQETGEC